MARPAAGMRMTETLLVYAARADHVARTIGPALLADKWVICDRFTDSTYAYQGAGAGPGARNHPPHRRGGAGRFQARPDPDAGPGCRDRAAARARRAAAAESRFEKFDRDFHERLRQAFLDIARRNPDRCLVIDAARSEDAGGGGDLGRGGAAFRSIRRHGQTQRRPPIETDRLEGFAHPRETCRLLGQDAALAAPRAPSAAAGRRRPG